jgi:multisubunit Na+/H+ antiporter MnhE subunit
MLRAIIEGAQLLFILLVQIVASGATTAWMIVSRGSRTGGGIVRMRYEGLSETGAAVLASMIAVTPGTTPVDIDHARGEMWIHFLDTEGAEASVTAIRGRFETRLRRLFPSRGEARE